MSRRNLQTSKPIVLTIVLGLAALSGCASKGDIEVLKTQIDSLQRTTAEALAEAKAARAMSNENQLELDSVMQTAQSAVQLAKDNDLKIDQAFNQSLKK